MGKDIDRSYKYYQSKISTPTINKPVLSSSANHTPYTTNSTPTIMSHQLQHKDSTSIQNIVNISNTDDIHSCVTPQKQNISVQATYTPPRLTPLITTLPILPVELLKTTHLCSKKLHLQSYLEMLWSETECFGLLGNNIILVIILLDLIER